jgi:hypothetical protein
MKRMIRSRSSRVLAVLLLLSLLLSLLAVAQQWSTVANTPKAGGLGQAVCGIGDQVLMMRGYSSGKCQYWQFDPSSQRITTLLEWSPPKTAPFNPIPRPKSGTALAWDQEAYVYVLFGGAGSDTSRGFFYRYEIETRNWTRLADSPHPQGAGNALTWCGTDKALYALLGSDKRGSILARYRPALGEWEKLPFNEDWVWSDDGASLAWAGGTHIYALNGEWDDSGAPHNDFARYNTETDEWENLAPIPETDAQGGSAGVGDGGSLLWIGEWDETKTDYIYALGGGGYREDPGYSFYRYSISTNSWSQLPDLTCPVGEWVGNRLAYAGSTIYCWQGNKSSTECGGSAILQYLEREG